jgi:hypothetical protein
MLCNATRRLGDGKHVILHQRVRGSVRAVRAVRNTRVFLTETRVVVDEEPWCLDFESNYYGAGIPRILLIIFSLVHWYSYWYVDNAIMV